MKKLISIAILAVSTFAAAPAPKPPLWSSGILWDELVEETMAGRWWNSEIIGPYWVAFDGFPWIWSQTSNQWIFVQRIAQDGFYFYYQDSEVWVFIEAY